MYKEEKYLLIIWSALVGVTLLSWEVGTGMSTSTPPWLIAAVLILTFIKVGFVVLDFMEVRHAPKILQMILGAWLMLTCVAMILVYLFI